MLDRGRRSGRGLEIEVVVDELAEDIQPRRGDRVGGFAVLARAAGSAADEVADGAGVGPGNQAVGRAGGEIERRDRELGAAWDGVEAGIDEIIAGGAKRTKRAEQGGAGAVRPRNGAQPGIPRRAGRRRRSGREGNCIPDAPIGGVPLRRSSGPWGIPPQGSS